MSKDSESFLLSLIRAENGEREGVCEMLWYFCEAVEDGKRPDRAVMEFVAERFRKILDGEKPDKAFGFTGKQGRPKSDTLLRDFLLAIEMVHKMKLGSTKDKSLEIIAKSRGVSESVIIRAWLEHKDIVDEKDIAEFLAL